MSAALKSHLRPTLATAHVEPDGRAHLVPGRAGACGARVARCVLVVCPPAWVGLEQLRPRPAHVAHQPLVFQHHDSQALMEYAALRAW